jgi:23S rRNA-/tRNA-specific pseudouridylate synthase
MIQHFRIPADGRLCDRVQDLDISLQTLQQLLSLGAIYLNGRRLGGMSNPSATETAVSTGDILRVHFRPRRFFWQPDDVKAWVRSVTEHTLIVYKPNGLPTHATLDNSQEHLLAHLHAGGYPEALMVQRLDIGTEGLMIFARHPQAQHDLQIQMQNREVLKVYSAIVEGDFYFKGEMMTWMQKSPRAPKQQHFAPGPDRESCLSHIRDANILQTADADKTYTEIALELITGRTHQIRSQLHAFGHSIVGDKMYGSNEAWLSSRNLENLNVQTESWALRCQTLGWTEDGIDQVYEVAAFTAADLIQRKKNSALVLSQSDFGSFAEPRSTRSLHKNPPGIRSIEARHCEDAHEPPSLTPQ